MTDTWSWPWTDPPMDVLDGTITLRTGETVSLAVVALIDAFAQANDLPLAGLIAIGLQESGLDPFAVNEAEGSYGVFQIYLRVHGGTPETWMGLEGLQRSMERMRTRWVSTFAARGGWAAWRRGAESFLQGWAPAAQGSMPWVVDGQPLAPRRLAQAMDVLDAYRLEIVARATHRAAQRSTRDLIDALTLAVHGLSDIMARGNEMRRAWMSVIDRYR